MHWVMTGIMPWVMPWVMLGEDWDHALSDALGDALGDDWDDASGNALGDALGDNWDDASSNAWVMLWVMTGITIFCAQQVGCYIF